MKKRIFIIHGYKSHSRDCWFPWLKKELTQNGYKVHILKMPTPANPKVKEWVSNVKHAIGIPDENTYLVGHSLGVITILRYIEKLNKKDKVGGIISVGGRVIGKNARPVIREFFRKPIHWNLIRKRMSKVVGIYSIDDPLVSLDNGRMFASKLKGELVIEKNKGHFSRIDKITKLPSAFNAILDINKLRQRTHARPWTPHPY